MAAIIASQPISTSTSTVVVPGDISTVPSRLKALEPVLLEIFKEKVFTRKLEVYKHLQTITITHKLENGVFCLLDLAAPGGEKTVSARRIPQIDVEALTNHEPSDRASITARLNSIVEQWLKADSYQQTALPDYASFSYGIILSTLSLKATSHTPQGQMTDFTRFKLPKGMLWKTKKEINHSNFSLELQELRDSYLKKGLNILYFDFQKVLDIFHANEVGTLLDVPNTPTILLGSPIPEREFLQSLTPINPPGISVNLSDQVNIMQLIERLGKENLIKLIENADSKTSTTTTTPSTT